MTAVLVRDRLYIGGRWTPSEGGETAEVLSSVTEEPLARVAMGTAADVERAATAAREAFDGWAATPVEERTAFLQRIHDGLFARLGEIGALIAQEVGTPISRATIAQVGLPALVAETYVEIARSFAFEEQVAASRIVHEPVGVVACLTPWNFPLHLAMCKVAPALAAGCTVVLKASELAPLSLFALADVVEEAGLPPGVFNLITGEGRTTGEALVTHPAIDRVSFTGSTGAGRRVAALAASTLKRTTLELGGKSASIVLDDADLEDAVSATVRQAFLNSGQTCMAWTRLLVPRHRQDEAAKIAAATAEALTLGDPLSDPDLGPLVSAERRERVRGHIRRALHEGAELVTGGVAPPPALDRGYFVRPTVFAGVTPEMAIAAEEVFGPVLAILAHDGDDDAVALANDSPYGLHGAVFSRDRERAERVARRLRTGQVDIGGAVGFNPWAPFGGYKQSGWGRELGRWGLEEFLEVKSIQLP